MQNLTLAIHHRTGSYSDRWIKYCLENNIKYKIVDCYKNDIFDQVKDCAGLMWHWDLTESRSHIFARQLTYALGHKAIKVYPDIDTSWHYDDKIGQKYLLEAIDAPFVDSYVFYSKNKACKWINDAKFPVVFKLRGGAGASNVMLIKNKEKAHDLIRKAFKKGFSYHMNSSHLSQRLWVLKRDKNLKSLKGLLIGFIRTIKPKDKYKFYPRQKGYIYFQKFIPNNHHDTRIVIIGNRCFGSTRFCRTGDFRASGSGVFTYNPDIIDKRMIKIAFAVSKKLNSQSLAFDFVLDNGEPKIIEISYCFAIECCDEAPGYWDNHLIWHEEQVNLQYYIIQDFIQSLKPKHEYEKISFKIKSAFDE